MSLLFVYKSYGRLLGACASLPRITRKINASQVRYLSLLEFQCKKLMQDRGIKVQKFKLVTRTMDADRVQQELKAKEYVIKAQILAGGRGHGHFDNGFKGGVHLTKDPAEIGPLLKQMLGHRLITNQTPKEGILVSNVIVAESVDIKRETYICILLDREHNGPIIIASPAGGMDIEDVAKKTPHLIKTIPIDICEGVTDQMASSIAEFLEFKGTLHNKAVHEIKQLWKFFYELDSTQLEVNPFAETTDGLVVSVDAKIQFDDNANFRQRRVFELEDFHGRDPRELRAFRYNLNYIAMSGNIGCLVNGAGLAMATMDIIHLHGGSPANFLDVGGAVSEEQVFQAFKILTSDPNVKSILVNIFGGIVNCATIAKGIINATKEIKMTIPLVVRLEGTNAAEAKKIMADSGLNIISASDFEDAALKAVASVK